MKKIFISMFAIAALAACSKSEEPQVTNPDALVPILLSSGVNAVTKAPIANGSTFNISVAGWEGATADYTQTATWNTFASNVVAGTASAVTLDAQKYYNSDDAVKTFMKAWSPKTTANPVAGQILLDAVSDGTVDVMLSSEVSGSNSANTTKNLTFDHKTMQIKFQVQADVSLSADTKLESIVIKNAECPKGLDLVNGVALFDVAKDLTVPSITSKAITTTAEGAGDPVMINKMGGTKLTLDITTNHASYSGVEATISGGVDFALGTAYTITLTFKQKSVALTASVTEWKIGSGAGTVE